jgi:hypothetical protein
MATRLKVTCNFKTETKEQNPVSMICFNPVVNGSEENKKFFSLTPGGIFQFYTINAEAAAQFEIGKEYYVDIFAVEPPSAGLCAAPAPTPNAA